MGRDVLVRDGFGARSPGIRMVPCWPVWRLYKPVRNKTDPIYVLLTVASKTKTLLSNRAVRQVPGTLFSGMLCC